MDQDLRMARVRRTPCRSQPPGVGLAPPGSGEHHVATAPNRGDPVMTEPRTCPRCGRGLPEDAPRGLCPACLLVAALAGPGDDPGEIRGPDSKADDTAADPQ